MRRYTEGGQKLAVSMPMISAAFISAASQSYCKFVVLHWWVQGGGGRHKLLYSLGYSQHQHKAPLILQLWHYVQTPCDPLSDCDDYPGNATPRLHFVNFK